MNSYQILLVEDEAPLRQTLERSLSRHCYNILAVGSMAEAMARLQADRVDLLLTDVALAGESVGFELAKWARALRPALPILLMSGMTLFATPDVLRADPAVRLLAKPFQIATLLTHITNLLAWREERPPNPAV